ncbi:minor capsid protein [Streptomyces scabiei]|uniref:minor capsid protein n=1 Tax=Streptomyces scabiei TaxID=1930 RepID=UPI0038F68CDD
MADFLDGIARHLDALSLVTYDPEGPTGDCFLDDMPSGPDKAVAITSYQAGVEPDSLLPYDEPRIQVRTRDVDPTAARTRCAAIYGELHGLGPVTLPDGTLLILCVALQGGPTAIGKDQNGRMEYVCNFRAEHRTTTAHRG